MSNRHCLFMNMFLDKIVFKKCVGTKTCLRHSYITEFRFCDLMNYLYDFNLIFFYPNLVTGGSSVHFHILSSESQKYFRNAIPMSGVIGNYWAMSEENDHLELAHKIARDLGEPKNSFEELVAFLKSTPADKLSEYSTIVGSNILFEIPFTPVIESKFPFPIKHFFNIFHGFIPHFFIVLRYR